MTKIHLSATKPQSVSTKDWEEFLRFSFGDIETMSGYNKLCGRWVNEFIVSVELEE